MALTAFLSAESDADIRGCRQLKLRSLLAPTTAAALGVGVGVSAKEVGTRSSLPVFCFAMADPLSLLQKYHLEKKVDEILERDGYIIFGDLAWPKDVSTNYRIYG